MHPCLTQSLDGEMRLPNSPSGVRQGGIRDGLINQSHNSLGLQWPPLKCSLVDFHLLLWVTIYSCSIMHPCLTQSREGEMRLLYITPPVEWDGWDQGWGHQLVSLFLWSSVTTIKVFSSWLSSTTTGSHLLMFHHASMSQTKSRGRNEVA